jgi:hypothetical protein
MKRLYLLAAGGLVALAGCTDEPPPTSVAPPGPGLPGFTIAVTPISSGATAAGMAQSLVGPGVTVQNATYTGHSTAAGTYTNGAGNVGFDGIVLSSGAAAGAQGPNDSPYTTSAFGTPGDPDVEAATGQSTYDASVLSFEIVPSSGDSVYFEYVFGSEEYLEFVDQEFIDGFVLMVNGQNCAKVGDPPVPITINTINPGANASLFRNNDQQPGPIDIEADGLTTTLVCAAAVTPGVPNTVKLAIADGFDFFYDSWVFIRQGSFSTQPPAGENAAPELAPIPQQFVDEGSELSFTATATDADAGQTLTYSLGGGAADLVASLQAQPVALQAQTAASIDPATGVFSWTPADDDPTGTPQDNHTFNVRVTDNGSPAAYDQQAVIVTVANVDPTVTSVTGPGGPVGMSGGSATAHISVSFTDPGTADTHTTLIDCGNSTAASAAGDCTYTAAGVYTVTATVNDNDGGSGSGTLQYVVVYDPDAGFVTGSGWITSPAGAYAANPALAGRASFGFVSRYQNGATVPSGQTRFSFQAGDLDFRGTAYEWLVVSGARAQYKGTGTINGSGSYSFLLTAIDGQVSGGGGVDRFRLKIWGPGGVIYDNQMGDGDDAPASTAIGGGSIVIHRQ